MRLKKEHSGNKKNKKFDFGHVKCDMHVRNLGVVDVLVPVYRKLGAKGECSGLEVLSWETLVCKLKLCDCL